jgi:hypothetical protein
MRIKLPVIFTPSQRREFKEVLSELKEEFAKASTIAGIPCKVDLERKKVVPMNDKKDTRKTCKQIEKFIRSGRVPATGIETLSLNRNCKSELSIGSNVSKKLELTAYELFNDTIIPSLKHKDKWMKLFIPEK